MLNFSGIKSPSDLHIHSCLSPCADDDMTPYNIAGLASLLELRQIALTDHNSTRNCPAFAEACSEYGIDALFGMELTTEEEIHAVCLFESLSDAMNFGEAVEAKSVRMPHDTAFYGRQILIGSEDKPLGELGHSLTIASGIPLYRLSSFIKPFHGFFFPAHIERAAFSLISVLGDVPGDYGFDTVEIRSASAVENLKSRFPILESMNILHNSDAHCLDNIGIKR